MIDRTILCILGLVFLFLFFYCKYNECKNKPKAAIYMDTTVYWDEPATFYYAVNIFNEDTVIYSYDLNTVLIGLKKYEIVGIFDMTTQKYTREYPPDSEMIK